MAFLQSSLSLGSLVLWFSGSCFSVFWRPSKAFLEIKLLGISPGSP